jgi:pSer/pThr/pTyr-binding forkhead associated (FHA) protein
MIEVPQMRQDSIDSPPAPSLTDGKSLGPPVTTEAPAVQDVGEPQPWRPVHRPPMATLHILDDGRNTAESVRIRTASCVIGRTEGDVMVVHDSQISTRHAEVTRALQEGKYSWRLHDLGSTNGTFARVKAAALKDSSEIMVGRHRFRFRTDSAVDKEPGVAALAEVPDIRQTCCWQTAESTAVPVGRPYLVELLAHGEGRRFPLQHDCEWMGRDSRQCSLTFPDDATMNSRHARLSCDSEHRWYIEDSGSLNGVWLRVTDVALSSQGSFLLGEQVFVIVIP